MKNFRIAMGVTGTLIVVSVSAYAWFCYPWHGLIERRIDHLGVAKLPVELDQWLILRGPAKAQEEKIPLSTLPDSLRISGADEAILRKEGLYLRVRKRFVEADYVLLQTKEDFPALLSSGDPSFQRIGDRIWIVKIKG